MCRCLKLEIQSKFPQTSILPLKFKVNFIIFDPLFHKIWPCIPSNSTTCQISSPREPLFWRPLQNEILSSCSCVSVGIIHHCFLKILCKCNRQIWSYHRISVVSHLAKFSMSSIGRGTAYSLASEIIFISS